MTIIKDFYTNKVNFTKHKKNKTEIPPSLNEMFLYKKTTPIKYCREKEYGIIVKEI